MCVTGRKLYAHLYDFILTWFLNEEARTKLSNLTRPACIFTLFCLYFLLLTTHIISKAVGSPESAYSLTSHLSLTNHSCRTCICYSLKAEDEPPQVVRVGRMSFEGVWYLVDKGNGVV